jgi:hypothetical protein
MYAIRTLPPNSRSDVFGLTLDEAFARIMALADRQYRFTRTGYVMHLLMTNATPGEPEFSSPSANNAVARREIKEQVCAHGLGMFQVMTDTEYERAVLGQGMAAE